MALPTPWTWVWVESGSWWWTGRPGIPVQGVTKSQTWLSDWTNWLYAAVNLPHWIYDADEWALSHKLERQALLVSTNRPLFSINSLFTKYVTCIGYQWIQSPTHLSRQRIKNSEDLGLDKRTYGCVPHNPDFWSVIPTKWYILTYNLNFYESYLS